MPGPPGIPNFEIDQKANLPTSDTFADQVKGGTFIVTGSNTGLGFEAAKALVRLHAAKVILAVRTVAKGEEAKSTIETETGVKGTAEVWELDMSKYESVIAFAQKVNDLERVDAIIENAGVALDTWTTGDKGVKTTILVNVTSTMLLAALTLNKLQESAKKFNIQPHLSIVGGRVALQQDARDELNKVPEDVNIFDWVSQESNGLLARYPLSKLILLFAIREFASRHPVSSTGVVVNFVNPGLCHSELGRDVENQEFRKMLESLRNAIGRSTEEGSRTLVHGAVAGESSHGTYLSECVPKQEYLPESIAGEPGQKLQKRVWQNLTDHLNQVSPSTL